MKEKSILFISPMVRATIEDSKTMTRRVVNPQPPETTKRVARVSLMPPRADGTTHELWWDGLMSQAGPVPRCPYGQLGDQLYVKETFYAWGRWETRFSEKKGRDEWHFIDMTLDSGKEYRYAASMASGNGPRQRGSITPEWWKRPAIFMPRIASRITLEITGVRVERLQDISEADAIAEGIEQVGGEMSVTPWRNYDTPDDAVFACHCSAPSASYRSLWQSINSPGSWEANPWVWVIEFKRVTA